MNTTIMNTTIELNNVHHSECDVKSPAVMKRVAEICSALFAGKDISAYGRDVDKVTAKLKSLGAAALEGDTKAIAELNTIVKFVIQPNLMKSTEVFSKLGNYHKIGFNEQAFVKTYSYEGIDARWQASHGDVTFGAKKWTQYPITTQTISAGMAIDYREIQSGNFDGSMAEEISQVQIDMNNKAVAYVLSVLHNSLKNNTEYVKFYEEYTTSPTQTAVDNMIKNIRRIGKVTIAGDYSVLSDICDFNGYKTVGANSIPFYNESQVTEMATAGLNGWYKGAALVELPNPYNMTKPLADKSGFETYYDADKLYFIPSGTNSPLNIFRRGGITTMSGNSVDTGTVMTRFDMEIGADVVKGREYEIGMLAKAQA